MDPESIRTGRGIPDLHRRLTIGELLRTRVEERDSQVFLIRPERDWEYSYRAFMDRVNQAAWVLLSLGISKGDKVSISMPNSPEFLFAYFGALTIGAVAGPVNPRLQVDEIAYILDHAEARVLFAPPEQVQRLQPRLKEFPLLEHLVAWTPSGTPPEKVPWSGEPSSRGRGRVEMGGGPGEKASTREILSMEALMEAVPASRPSLRWDVLPEDEAMILYTSGTTGKPKGVLLTHHNLIIDSHWIAHWSGLDAADRAMCVMPLFHVNGQVVTVLTPLYCGGSIVLPERFSASRFFPLIAKYRVTFTGTVATMLSMLLNTQVATDLDWGALRIVFCGSAPVPVEVQKAFELRFGVPVIEGYGMTETTCRSTFNRIPPPDRLKLGESDGFRKLGSVGLPIGNDMKVVDDQGRELPPGRVGEILIRGENVMKGYFKDSAANRGSFDGDWFRSGDLGYRDEDGYYYVVDRKKDMIIRGGENIYPREIDEVLYRHPAIRDAAAVGLPDPLYGEEVAAFVVLKEGHSPSAQEIMDFCGRILADFKCPRKVIFVDEIPKGPSGKLLRRELLEMYEKGKISR